MMPRGKGINMVNKGKDCRTFGCSRSAVCKGYCMSHYILRRDKDESDRDS